jgi:hypothetical protein
MIEIKEVKDKSGRFAEERLFVDGVLYEHNIYVKFHPYGQGNYHSFEVRVYDKKLINILKAYRLNDIPDKIAVLTLRTKHQFIRDEPEISQDVIVYKGKTGQHYIALEFSFDGDNWARLWSITEYKEEFKAICEQQALSGIFLTPLDEMEIIDVEEYELSLSVPIQDRSITIEAEAQKYSGDLQRLHELTEAALSEKLYGESVVVHFDFPEEVRIPCEQYLIYFVQFLKDLGVEATAELQHEAGQVLFAVTPANQEEALGKIREALQTYLSLAASPVSNLAPLDYEIAIQRLVSEVQHLQSRISLARAELQLREATIQTQQATIMHLSALNEGVMVESLERATLQRNAKDTEEVLGGIVEITKYEGKGVNINLAEIFRRLRQFFSEEKK